MTAFNSRLKSLCDNRESWLCVGLDMNPEAFGSNDLANLKDHTFNVIDATRDLAVAYKPNFAFFERFLHILTIFCTNLLKYPIGKTGSHFEVSKLETKNPAKF